MNKSQVFGRVECNQELQHNLFGYTFCHTNVHVFKNDFCKHRNPK